MAARATRERAANVRSSVAKIELRRLVRRGFFRAVADRGTGRPRRSLLSQLSRGQVLTDHPTILRAAAIAILLATAGCATSTGGGGGAASAGTIDAAASGRGSADAILKTADGTTVGRAVATAADGGVRIAVEAANMPPGTHGIHVHTVGRCDAPDFATAGGHWNPGGRMHGAENPAGPHAGDLPNLVVGTDGHGTLSMTLPAGSLAAMLDADGAALVVHAAPDDLRTDPSGNSGGRIACGVFVRP